MKTFILLTCIFIAISTHAQNILYINGSYGFEFHTSKDSAKKIVEKNGWFLIVESGDKIIISDEITLAAVTIKNLHLKFHNNKLFEITYFAEAMYFESLNLSLTKKYGDLYKKCDSEKSAKLCTWTFLNDRSISLYMGSNFVVLTYSDNKIKNEYERTKIEASENNL